MEGEVTCPYNDILFFMVNEPIPSSQSFQDCHLQVSRVRISRRFCSSTESWASPRPAGLGSRGGGAQEPAFPTSLLTAASKHESFKTAILNRLFMLMKENQVICHTRFVEITYKGQATAKCQCSVNL